MRVHFMSAVDGDKDLFAKITATIDSLGHELVTNHYLERKVEDIKLESSSESELYAKKVHKWIRKADVVIFETTKPDVSVGFELALALNMMKPVIVLYHKDNGIRPFSLQGISTDKLQLLSYDENTLVETLTLALEYALETSDVRFNFFISPSIGVYLDWISKYKKIPRSVYLRSLIEQDMLDNEEFNNS